MTRRAWLLAAVAVAGLAATIAVFLVLEHVGPLPGDRAAVGHLRHPGPSAVRDLIAGAFSLVAFAPVALVTVVLLWQLLAVRVSAGAAWLMALGSAAPVASTTLKVLLGPVPLDRLAFARNPSSYPSGHVAYICGLGGYLAVLAWRAGRRGLAGLLLVVIVAMGPMRVWGVAHLPSDCLGGYLLGGGWLAMVLAVEELTGGRRAADPGSQ